MGLYNSYGNAIVNTSWGGRLKAYMEVASANDTDTTATIIVTGFVNFCYIDGWTNATVTTTLYKGSTLVDNVTETYSGPISDPSGGQSTSSNVLYTGRNYYVNRSAVDDTYTAYCTLKCNGETSSTSISFTIDKIPYSKCGAPTSVSTSAAIIKPSGTLTVEWSGASGGTSNAISGYDVYYRIGSAPTTSTYTGTTSITSTSASGSTTFTLPSTATRGSKIYAGVITKGAAGSSYYSSIKTSSGGSVVNTLPGAPSISGYSGTITLPPDTASITLTTVPGATGDTGQTATVYYATSSAGAKTKATSNQFTTSTIAQGGSKTYYLWTWDGLEYSSYSTIGVFRAYPGVCTAPTSVSIATPSRAILKPGENITISWSGAAGGTANSITGYDVYYRIGSSPTTSSYTDLLSVASTSTSGSATFTLPSNATRGSSVYVAVVTKGSAGADYYSSMKHGTSKPINILPNTPTVSGYSGTNVSVSLNAATSSVTLTTVPGATGESTQSGTVYYATSSTGSKNLVSNNSLSVTNVDYGSSVKRYLWTYDGLEYSSSYTTVTVTRATPVAVTTPTVTTASAIVKPSGSFTVNWSGASGSTGNAISGYDVYYRVGGNPTISTYASTTSVSSSVSSVTFTFSSAARGSKLYAGVIAKGAAGPAYYSSMGYSSGNISVNQLPAIPTITNYSGSSINLAATVSTVSIEVSPGDTNDTGQTGQVYYATSSTGTKTEAKSNKFTATVASEGSSQSYYLWTWDGLEYSSSYKTITVNRALSAITSCQPPTSFTTTPAIAKPSGSLTVSWSGAVGGNRNAISGYDVYYRIGSEPTTTTYTGKTSITSTSTSSSTTFTLPSNASRGSKIYAGIIVKGEAGSSYYSTFKKTTGDTVVNTLPAAPIITGYSGSDVTINLDFNTSSTTVVVSPGNTNDTGQAGKVYSATSSTGTKTELNSDNKFTATVSQAGSTSNYYFWTKDDAGEFSSTYTILRVNRGATPTNCSAPTSVSASGIITPSGEFTVSWSGASGGTNNAISSYQVYYKVSSNGTAPTTSDYTGTVNVTSTATSGSKTITLSSATRGYKVVCGVVTRGTAGSSYYSGIKTGGLVTINSLPAIPSITSPTAATNTYTSTTASVNITVSPGADTDSSQTTSVWYATSTTGTKTQVTNNTLTVSMTAGTSYTRYFWTYDGLEYSSNYASVTVRRNSAPSLSPGTATNTTKSCGVSGFDNTKYIVGVTLPITGTKGTYGSASKLYYRVVYGTIGGTNNNPSYTSVTTTSGTAYNLTLNLNSIIGAPNKQWYIEYYYHDGIQETAHAFYPAKSGSTINYYYLAPSPSISEKYNQQANSNITNTQSEHFYQKVRLKYTYDTDLTAVSKVTYRIGTGAESNATINSSAYNATSGTNNIDITLPNNLTPNTTYTFTVYVTNGSFNKTFTTTMVQSPIPTINSLSETPAIWKPYTYNGNMIFNIGITGVSGTNFYTTNNLNSTNCFKIYFKGNNSKVAIPWSKFTTSTSTDTLQLTCNCATNGTDLLALTKTNNPLGNDYNTNYSISWVFEITNLFGKVISFETSTTYKIDFYESVTTPIIKVEMSNSAGTVWTELTTNERWRPQETGKLRFTSTCTSYNTTPISSIIQINRSSTTTQGSWSDYDKVSTQVMTRSGSVGFLNPYTFTRTDTITIPELTTNDYIWFRSKVTRGSEAALTSAASKRTMLICHYQATNFVLNSTGYTNGIFTGSAKFTKAGVISNSAYTLTWEKKLLLNSTNSWPSGDTGMSTKVLDAGTITDNTQIMYSVSASELSPNPGTNWERLYTKIKFTTTITQTVGSVSIQTQKITYTEPYAVVFNVFPTIAYQKNKIGINTHVASLSSDDVLSIHPAEQNQYIKIHLNDNVVGKISLDDGSIDNFIIDGGQW